MRIAVVSAAAPPDTVGAIEAVLDQLAEYLGRDNELLIVAGALPKQLRRSECKIHNATLVRIPELSLTMRPWLAAGEEADQASQLRLRSVLWRELGSFRPDVVHGFDLHEVNSSDLPILANVVQRMQKSAPVYFAYTPGVRFGNLSLVRKMAAAGRFTDLVFLSKDERDATFPEGAPSNSVLYRPGASLTRSTAGVASKHSRSLVSQRLGTLKGPWLIAPFTVTSESDHRHALDIAREVGVKLGRSLPVVMPSAANLTNPEYAAAREAVLQRHATTQEQQLLWARLSNRMMSAVFRLGRPVVLGLGPRQISMSSVEATMSMVPVVDIRDESGELREIDSIAETVATLVVERPERHRQIADAFDDAVGRTGELFARSLWTRYAQHLGVPVPAGPRYPR